MISRILLLCFLFFQSDLSAQTDSVWNVMLLQKGNQPEIKNDMASFSPTGFYLYRNCFYDLKFTDKKQKTLRLIDIRPDTLIFIGISGKTDVKEDQVSNDTITLDYRTIDKLLLIIDWSAKNSKKIDCEDYYFLFYKSVTDNRYDSKYAPVFPNGEPTELVPRVSARGITYHYEYAGKLHYYSVFAVQAAKDSDEQKAKTLNTVLKVLDIIINKRMIVPLKTMDKKEEE